MFPFCYRTEGRCCELAGDFRVALKRTEFFLSW